MEGKGEARSADGGVPALGDGSLECPRDGVTLEETRRHGVPGSRCSECNGLWLDPASLEQLEDRAFSEDEVKGTLKYGSHEADLDCPHCGKKMVRFRYRANPLELDHCPDDAGYWLDKDEDRRIMEFMRERESGLRRSVSAQRDWQRLRRGRSGGSFIDRVGDRIRNLFGRR